MKEVGLVAERWGGLFFSAAKRVGKCRKTSDGCDVRSRRGVRSTIWRACLLSLAPADFLSKPDAKGLRTAMSHPSSKSREVCHSDIESIAVQDGETSHDLSMRTCGHFDVNSEPSDNPNLQNLKTSILSIEVLKQDISLLLSAKRADCCHWF